MPHDLSFDQQLASFYETYPDFDILSADLIHPDELDRMGLSGSDQQVVLERLRAYQRLLRIDGDPGVASALLGAGYDSAYRIVNGGRTRFEETATAVAKGVDSSRANVLFERSKYALNRAQHMAAGVHSKMGSRLSRATRSMSVGAEDERVFQSLSSYQQLFGSLDYCSCEECSSILGPPAYLVDLLRVIETAITDPNTANPSSAEYQAALEAWASDPAGITEEQERTLFQLNIPPGLRLVDRRPDIYDMLLTCANTFDEVLYLDLVNEILQRTVTDGLTAKGQLVDGNPWLSLATRYFPSNLPFDQNLQRTRSYLQANEVALEDVYSALAQDPSTEVAVGRERLQMSVLQLANIEPQDPANLDAVLTANYGLTISGADIANLDQVPTFLAQTGLDLASLRTLLLQDLGPQEIFDVSGAYTPNDWGTAITLEMDGSTVSGTYDYQGGLLEGTLQGQVVRGQWTQTDGKGDFEFTFDDGAQQFTGKWSSTLGGAWESDPWNGARQAGTPSNAGIIPHALYINRVLDAGQYLHVLDGDPQTIAFQDAGTLDTLNRFLRLSRILGWTPAQLDWALTSLNAPTVDGRNLTNATTLTADTVLELSKIARLITDHGLTFELATSLWFDLRTTGRGDAGTSQAPFDVVFNDPAVMKQFGETELYRPVIAPGPTSYPNPLYAGGPESWDVPSLGSRVAPAVSTPTAGDLLVSSIPVNSDDLFAIANAAFGSGSVSLTVPKLSLLYRHAVFANHLQWRADGYLAALRLLDYMDHGLPETLDRDQALAVADLAEQLASSELTIYDIDYACNLTPNASVQIGYDPTAIPDLLPSLATGIAATLANEALFESQGIDTKTSGAYVQVLRNAGFIDPLGIVLRTKGVDLASVGDYVPGTAAPTQAQLDYVQKKLETALDGQQQQASSVLTSFYGATSSAMNTTLEGASLWLGYDGIVEPYLVRELFRTDAGPLFTGVGLDVQKVIQAFSDKGRTLSADTSIAPLVVTSWAAVGSDDPNATYTVSTPDLQVVEAYSGGQLLFTSPWSDVSTSGDLDPTKLATAFAGAGHDIGTITLTILVTPNSWLVSDPVSQLVYSTTRSANGAKIDFKTSVTDTAAPASPKPDLDDLFAMVSQLLVVQQGLPSNSRALSAVTTNPAPFGLNPTAPVSFTLDAIRATLQFAAIEQQLNDQTGALQDYFDQVTAGGNDAAYYNMALSKISGWDEGQIGVLASTICDDSYVKTVPDLVRVQRAFGVASALGSDATYLVSLYAQRGTAPSVATWSTLVGNANQALQLARAGTTATAWPTVFQQLDGPLQVANRDALVPIAIWLLAADWNDINSPDSLYEYLLIDVEMSGCSTISPLKEALNAAQLYLQRCRLSLERNAPISPTDLPAVWWEWLMAYRVWQANREIFLYPENYIVPSLRHPTTSLFTNLKNALLQGQLTTQKVESAFRGYIESLSEVANLTIVDTYRATADQAGTDTLYVFARTAAQPFNFFVASRTRVGDCDQDSAWEWTEWKPIGITINASLVTPIYAFNKLLLFWVELTRQDERDDADPPKKYSVTTAAIRYSRIDNQGNWMQPQTLLDGLVVDVQATDPLYGAFWQSFTNPGDLFWQKVNLVHVPADGAGQKERIVLSYGPYVDMYSGDTTEPPNPSKYQGMPNVVSFVESIVETNFVRGQLKAFESKGYLGQTPMQNVLVLDQYLEPTSIQFDNQYLLLGLNGVTDQTAPYFRPAINGTALAVQEVESTLFDNFVAGTSIAAPLILAANADIGEFDFESTVISQELSSSIYTTLSSPMVGIIANGKVTASGVNAAYAMLKAQLGMDDITVRHVREVLFEHYYGTPSLFSSVSTKGAVATTVRNLPSSFVLTTGGETFLLDGRLAQTSGATPLTDSTALASPIQAVVPEVFTSYNIDEATSRLFYQSLSATGPSQLIGAGGVVNTTVVQSADVRMIAALLSTDVGRAQQVKSTLLQNFGPAQLTYSASGYQPDTRLAVAFDTTRLSTGAIHHLTNKLYMGGIDALLELDSQQAPVNIELEFDRLAPTTETTQPTGSKRLNPPDTLYGDQVDFDGPFGIYYWELFFHAPFLVAEMLHDDQQFDEAEQWLQYVFNPTLAVDPLTQARFVADRPDDVSQSQAEGMYTILTTPPNQLIDQNGNVLDAANTVDVNMLATALGTTTRVAAEIKNLLTNNYLATPLDRYWQFAPLRNRTLQSLREQLTNCAQIAAYNNDPFNPDAIARLRVGAYEKAVVLYYIQNLLDWGDFEFSQYSWESITTARMLYVYANDLLGPKPQSVGDCQSQFPVSFGDILAKYGGEGANIPQFVIDMENGVGMAVPEGVTVGDAVTPYNDIGGYFCVPENSNLEGLWSTVEDRLYKIRHCLNIDGQPQPLPLFQPPINPADLVRAGASGASVLASQSHLQPLIPNYRFDEMIRRATSVTQTVSSFGQQLLSALEKNDAEGLTLLRSNNEIAVLNMITAVKQAAIEEAQAQQDGLQESLDSANYRYGYYDDLLATGLNAAEIANYVLLGSSLIAQGAAVPFHGLAIAGYLAPNIFGLADGGMKFGDAINAGAQIAGTVAQMLGTSAQIAQVAGDQQRRAQTWGDQKTIASYDAKSLTSQITAAEARIQQAQSDLAAHLRRIDASNTELQYLKTKFTNQQLYQWMVGRISTVYFQAYRVAYELTLAAQTAYQFELDTDKTFINYGYWDDLHQGLLAGEGLLLGLAQLESAYLDRNTRRLEIVKTISMRQEFPDEFFGFRWGYLQGTDASSRGTLNFTLSEKMLDQDFPGHYLRKIASVSVSIPAVLGPYQDIHATLTQRSNTVLLEPNADAVNYLIWRSSPSSGGGKPPPAPPAGVLRENWVPNQQIAVSKGVDDNGLFVLDFRDPRYLPFEGTGAVSSWTFTLPPDTNAVDFDAISDVIVRVRYSARDGGQAFANGVRSLYSKDDPIYEDVRSTAFTLAQSFSPSWNAMFQNGPIAGTQATVFSMPSSAVQPNTRRPKLVGVLVQLELSDGSSVSDAGSPFLALQIAGQPKTPVPISLKNNFGELDAAAVAAFGKSFVGVDWALSFDIANTPAALLTDGALNATQLANVAVVMLYSST